MQITINISRPDFGKMVANTKASVKSGVESVKDFSVNDKVKDFQSNRVEALTAKLADLKVELSNADVEDEKAFAKLEDAINKTQDKLA